MQNETFEKYWAPIATTIGAVLLIINFLGALQGDKTFSRLALILVSLVAIIAGLWKYAFARSDKAFERNGKYGFEPKYKYHWAAKISILVGIISIFVSIGYSLTLVEIIPDCCGIVPTQTPTSTSVPIASETLVGNTAEISPPIMTATVTSTPTQLVILKNCISDKVWMPYNSETRNKDEIGCWDLFDWGILAKDDGVQISKAVDNATELSHGMYSPLPQNARVEFTLRIDKIDSVSDLEPRLEFGILPLNPANIDKGIFIFIQRESYNDETFYVKLHNPLLNHDEYVPLRYVPGEEKKVVIVINGLQLDIFMGDDKIVDALPLGFPMKGFWLGYSLPGGTSLSTYISNIVIKDLPQ